MGTKTCQLCGCEDELGPIKECHVIPQEIAGQASIDKSRIIRLCSNCQLELNRWYATKVADMAYDTSMKQFRAKSPPELVKEYEIAYQRFARYKKEQTKIA